MSLFSSAFLFNAGLVYITLGEPGSKYLLAAFVVFALFLTVCIACAVRFLLRGRNAAELNKRIERDGDGRYSEDPRDIDDIEMSAL